MRDPAVCPDVTDPIKQSSLFAIAAPGAEQLANSIALFAFSCSPARIEQQLLYQSSYETETVPDENKRMPVL
jgi:hypothetical protein